MYIEGLSEHKITSVRQALALIVQGEERRKVVAKAMQESLITVQVAATDWNDHSSRSHTLFRLCIDEHTKVENHVAACRCS